MENTMYPPLSTPDPTPEKPSDCNGLRSVRQNDPSVPVSVPKLRISKVRILWRNFAFLIHFYVVKIADAHIIVGVGYFFAY